MIFPINLLIFLICRSGVFPSALKIAKAVHLNKKDSKLDFFNYRLISPLLNLDKYWKN